MTIVKLQTAARVTGAKIVCESSGRFSTYQVEAPQDVVIRREELPPLTVAKEPVEPKT